MTTTRQAIADAFRIAQQNLWDGVNPQGNGTTRYICVGLSAVGDAAAQQAARLIIKNRLSYHPALEGWLFHRCGVPLSDLTDASVQAHRLAWLDQLIAEFEAPTTTTP